MTRRLLGYRVKRADGTASGIIAPEPVHDMTLSRDARDSCYLVPVFAVRKPKPAELKPAPVVAAVAAEGRYACLIRRLGFEYFFAETVEPENQLHERAVAEDVARRQRAWADAARVVRVFEDGEHEAALAAAYERGKAERPTASAAPVAYRYDVAGYPPSWATFRIGDVQGQTETPLYDEAALAAAREEGRREERERVRSALATERARVAGKTSDGYLDALEWMDNEAAKGAAK